MKSLGIMGGTFDPIHYGHLVAAEGARHQFNLDKVIFVPSGRPPHKTENKISDPSQRLAMTNLAIASNNYFDISAIEVERPGLSYTIDTVLSFRSMYRSSKLYFITGGDAVLEILTWKDVGRLISLCTFIAATRPGYHLEHLEQAFLELPAAYRKNIHIMEVPALAISSTDIRERIRTGRPIKYLLPESVEQYVNKHNLYK
ncbi:nicotinate-nucleotide adenylyltransferase [Desulfolucanica intricata]|uniref:nicotinate-nucleotide adenylyltransferase n=1 Tax=Desulfolucanica intricata TaxID=1285191 RepID=UPI00082FEF06|nr:nicotinate-nucleotide adenylyltransferase [Desulfolucanica intricata]